MKTFKTLLIAVISVAVLLIVSCSKETVDDIVDSRNEDVLLFKSGDGPCIFNLRWDIRTDPWGTCPEEGINCCMYSSQYSLAAITQFEDSIAAGTVSIVNYFDSDEYLNLFTDWNETPYIWRVDSMISGNYSIQKYSTDNNILFYFGKSPVDSSSFEWLTILPIQ